MKYFFAIKINVVSLWHYDLSGKVLGAVIQSLKIFFWKNFTMLISSERILIQFQKKINSEKMNIFLIIEVINIKGDIKRKEKKWKEKKIMMKKLSPWSSPSHSWLTEENPVSDAGSAPSQHWNPVEALPFQA